MKYKINDLAKILGVTTNAIRMYENEGYIKPERDNSNYRWYSEHDIMYSSVIRMLIKCGFPHSSIKEMSSSDSDRIHQICSLKLEEIDAEMKRLYFLRHWLKDNIQLFDTILSLKDKYTTMKNPPVKYILYSKDDELMKEKDRLNAVNKFIFDIPETQIILILKREDILNDKFIPYKGWSMKEIDIQRLNVEHIIESASPFIEDYPSCECLYSSLEINITDITDKNKLQLLHSNFFKKALAYMEENNMTLSSDIMEIHVPFPGNTIYSLICMPFTPVP